MLPRPAAAEGKAGRADKGAVCNAEQSGGRKGENGAPAPLCYQSRDDPSSDDHGVMGDREVVKEILLSDDGTRY